MESYDDQAAFHSDDKQLPHGINFCLQTEVQMPLSGTGYPVPHDPVTLATCALQESEMNVDIQQDELVGGSVVQDSSTSVIENGGELGISDTVGNQSALASYVDQEQADSVADGVSETKAYSDGPSVANLQEQDKTTLITLPADGAAVAKMSDYGESVAMEDFGGQFEDGDGIEESSFTSVNVFADNEGDKSAPVEVSAATADANDAHVVNSTEAQQPVITNTGPEEQPDAPETLDKILPKSPAAEGSVECEEEPPVLEREFTAKSEDSKQKEKVTKDDLSLKVRPRRSRHLSSERNGADHELDNEQSTSNMDLNVNSRPRRSVNRKSVFEMLHVDYRYVGGAKKAATPRGGDGDINHESTAKKQKSPRKSVKLSKQPSVESQEGSIKAKRREHIQDIDNRINVLKNRVVAYRPDDFLDGGDEEPEKEVIKDKQDKEVKSAAESDQSLLRESLFSEPDDRAARSFLAVFAAESAEALSSSAEGSSDLGALIAENQDLRSRIKALEQSKSLVRKFNIDFHGRKFSRIRSPASVLPDQQKTPGKIVGIVNDRTPATEQKAPVETGESMLSRMAVLDRREHKLRELSAELDERATSVRIAEGALHRRERKLIDFEKTLEHRERVLSRHEQNILKRELELGSPSVLAGDIAAEPVSDDRQSFATEMQRRLEQRRLELDRRQAVLSSEQARLRARERELDQLESNSRSAKFLADKGSGSSAGNEEERKSDDDLTSSRASKRSGSLGKQKRKASVSQSIRSKYLSPKKQKVSPTPASKPSRKSVATPDSSKKAYVLRHR